jgi:retinol dehydrogenase-12
LALHVSQNKWLCIFLTVFTLYSNSAFSIACVKAVQSPYKADHLAGKVAMVTGATFGIGKATALGLAKQGAEVIIVGRDFERTKATVEWIKAESGNPKISFLIADLSIMKQVKKLADEFKDQYPRLDILVNNAGAIFTKKEMTSENIEKTWAINHLSPLLLTLELTETLKASAPARVVNVASALYERGKITLEAQDSNAGFKGLDAYGDSKLATMLVSFNLAKGLQSSGVQINTLHPGFVDTGIGTNNTGPLKWLLVALKPIKKFLAAKTSYMLTPEEGAQTSIYLASSSEVEGVSGQYYNQGVRAPVTSSVLDETLQQKVLDFSLAQIQEALR